MPKWTVECCKYYTVTARKSLECAPIVNINISPERDAARMLTDFIVINNEINLVLLAFLGSAGFIGAHFL
jgi:hypothetical protein